MAGNLTLKTGTAVTVTSTGSSVATGTAVSAGTVDLRSAGTANLIEQLMAFAQLTAQFATITSIAQGTIIADLYLVPALDGTNYVTVDTTSGTSYISSAHRVGSFICSKAPTAATDQLYATAPFDLFPALYTAYLLFRAGQTVTANWTLKILPAEAAYT
jgi:hypothetical protein